MPYKVFLVEDEITTREGIRDNVDWRSVGFELCGEAPDGEIALPQIETVQPDVLITDIKMPFMDGLQLCTIIREHMPWMKIIIISGYNDFTYAQTAIKLGVTEYLLKPVSVQDLQAILSRVASILDQERSERAYLKRLRSQVEDNLSLLREKFLLRIVLGGESSISAIEQSQQLGLNLLSRYYQVILFEVEHGAEPFDYPAWQQVEKLVAGLVATNTDVLLTKKDLELFLLILKGDNLDQLEQEGSFLAEMICSEVESKTPFRLAAGFGSLQQRLGDLHRSYSEALVKVKGSSADAKYSELKKPDPTALLNFLESGRAEDFDSFFDQTIRPLSEAALQSNLLKQYVLVDILLTVAQFISDLGGNTDRAMPEIHWDDAFLTNLKNLDQIRDEIRRLFIAALAFRDSHANNDRAAIIQQAKAYISSHFSDSDLSLNEVAAQVNFSPNHFSAVFSSETGVTFRDYLTRSRVEQAKKLLRSTNLKCSEVALRCGYNDPHYFSVIFRKNSGMTPQQFRAYAKQKKQGEQNGN